MFASLSAEKRIEDRRQLLGCSAIFLSSLAGIPASRLSFALRGLKPLENVDAIKLLDLTDRLLAIKEAFSPLPIALVNPEEVRGLLHAMDRRGMMADDIRQIVSKIFEQDNSSAL